MSKTPVYFIPGLGANSLIFEKIDLPKDQFECFFIEWKKPLKNENLNEYTQRLIKNINHKSPIIIGVSFGGIIAQEIAKSIQVEKTIIISSVKNENELPILYRVAKKLNLQYLPLGTFFNKIFNIYKKTVTSKKKKERFKLYNKYLSFRSNSYLNWGIKNILNWKNTNANLNIVHIHGTDDEIFPSKNIKNAIFLPKAKHTLILTNFKWLNQNLPEIILENEKKADL
nr:alpha/beta hydrolase [uncultured Flavobacterium sp.]